MAVFGLPFFAAGIFLVLVGLGLLRLENSDEVPRWGWPLMTLMGLVFAGIGGGLAFGRRWTTVDLDRRVLIKEWGPLVPVRREEHRLGDFDAVLLRLIAGDSDTSDSYEVLLRRRDGRGPVLLSSSQVFGESRERAGEVAKLLGFPLSDASAGTERIIPPERVDTTFQERLQAGEEGAGAIPRPFRPRCQVREFMGRVEISLPGPDFRPLQLLGVALPVAAAVLIGPSVLRFLRDTGTPVPVQVAMVGFATLFFLIIPAVGVLNAFLRSERGGWVLEASPDGIALEERGAWSRKRRRVAASEILGLHAETSQTQVAAALRDGTQRAGGGRRTVGAALRDRPILPPSPPRRDEPGWLRALRRLVPSKGVVIRTRTDTLAFGHGLPDDEVLYIHALVLRALGGPDGGA